MLDFGYYNMEVNMTYKMSSKNKKNKREHRIVVENFLNRELSPSEIIHHIDGNKRNNILSNLQLLTRREHAIIHYNSKKMKKPIIQKRKNGEFVKEWGSATDVMKELGYINGNISKCCKGKIKSAYGYVWEYKYA